MGNVEAVYGCPYCTNVSFRGVPAKTNLVKHVKSRHHDQYNEFKKIPNNELITMEPVAVGLTETRIVEPQPTTEATVSLSGAGDTKLRETEERLNAEREKNNLLQQQIQQRSQVDTSMPPSTAPLPTYIDELPPEQMLKEFLKHYRCKEMFIVMMADSIRMTGNPPDVATLVQALKNMDSGHNKTPLQAEFIGQMYQARLEKYWKRQQELKFTHKVSQAPGDPYGYGTYPQQPAYGNQDRRYNQPPSPLYRETYDNRVTKLEDDLRKRDEQDRRNLEATIEDFKRQLEASKTTQQNPQIIELQRQLKEQADDNKRIQIQQDEENRRLQQQMSEQREMNLLAKINQATQYAQQTPSIDQLDNIITKRMAEERDRYTGTDLKAEMEKRFHEISTQRGTTQMDVELKKAEHDLEKTKMEINAESKKTEVWGENLKGVADVAAEALGRGLATVGQPQPTTQQPGMEGTPPPGNQILCPSCGTQLQLPPGVTEASCGKCRAQFTMDADGAPQLIGQRMRPIPPPTEEQPLSTQAGFTVERDADATGPDDLPEGMHVQQGEKPPTEPSETVRAPPVRKMPPPTTQQKTPEQTMEAPTPSQPPETSLGACPKCGRLVYDSNIGKTEGGQPYHKECV